jgi:hypothetical protein
MCVCVCVCARAQMAHYSGAHINEYEYFFIWTIIGALIEYTYNGTIKFTRLY